MLSILMTIGIIAILAVGTLTFFGSNKTQENPAGAGESVLQNTQSIPGMVGKIEVARDLERMTQIQSLKTAINQKIADDFGIWKCSAGPLPKTPAKISSSGGYNLAPCLVPDYLPVIPINPKKGSWADIKNYDSGYVVSQTATGEIIIE